MEEHVNPLPNIADNESITTENNPNFLSKVSVVQMVVELCLKHQMEIVCPYLSER